MRKERGECQTPLGKEKIPIQDELIAVEASTSDDDKKVKKLGELNELGYEDLILLINGTKPAGKVAFKIVKDYNSPEYPEGNCKQA